jgi:hypothetical protein
MSLITEKPDNLPSTNDLDDIPDDLLGPVPARVEMSGKILFVMDEPVQIGQCIKAELLLECYDDGRTKLDDGELVHYRKTKMLSAKVIGDPYTPAKTAEPKPDPDPALLGDSGEINPDAIAGEQGEETPELDDLPTVGDDEDAGPAAPTPGLHAVDNPPFSHNGSTED